MGVACGSGKKKPKSTTTTAVSTAAFCEKAPAVAQMATDVFGTELSDAQANPDTAYAKFRDDERSLTQSVHDLAGSAPDAVKADLNTVGGGLDKVTPVLDTNQTASPDVLKQVADLLADPNLQNAVQRVGAYISDNCGGTTTTSGPSTTTAEGSSTSTGGIPSGRTPTTRRPTVTTKATVAGATTTTIPPTTTTAHVVTTSSSIPATSTSSSTTSTTMHTTTTSTTLLGA